MLGSEYARCLPSALYWTRRCGPPPAERAAAAGGAGSRPQPGAAGDSGTGSRHARVLLLLVLDRVNTRPTETLPLAQHWRGRGKPFYAPCLNKYVLLNVIVQTTQSLLISIADITYW